MSRKLPAQTPLLLSCAGPGDSARPGVADSVSAGPVVSASGGFVQQESGLFVTSAGGLRAELGPQDLVASRDAGELRLRFSA